MDKHQDDATIVILGMEHQRELYHLGLVNASHPQISKSVVEVLGSFWDGFLDPEKNMHLLSGATLILKTKSCCIVLTCAVSW